MALILITPPTEEPITLAESKLIPKIETSDDDALLDFLRTAARLEAEKITHRKIITQTWDLYLDAFPSGGIVVPHPPLQSVSYVKYVDGDGTLQTLDALDYAVDAKTLPGLIVPAYGLSWPTTRSEINAVQVRFVAGYGDAEDVPKNVKVWMMHWIATHYEHRENIVIGQTMAELPRSFIDGLLDDEVVYY